MPAGVRIVGNLPLFTTPAQVLEAATAAVREASTRNVSRIKEVLFYGRDSRGFVGRKDTGLAHSLVGTSEPVIAGGKVFAVAGIGSPRDVISSVLEDGRTPGRSPPPAAALAPWVRRKLRDAIASSMKGARVSLKAGARFSRLQEKAAKAGRALGKGIGPKVTGVGKNALEAAVQQVSRQVARSIGKKGTPGLRPFKIAKAAMDKDLDGIYRRHLARVTGGKGRVR